MMQESGLCLRALTIYEFPLEKHVCGTDVEYNDEQTSVCRKTQRLKMAVTNFQVFCIQYNKKLRIKPAKQKIRIGRLP